MSTLLAMDVAILPPPDVSRRAIDYSASLTAPDPSDVLRLDAEHLPHITLTQQFIREEELESAFERIDQVVRDYPPLRVRVSGAARSAHTITMVVERTPELVALHEQIMEALRGLERPEGGPAAFLGGDGRLGDVLWVSSYRLKSSFAAYQPHITLGHGDEAPNVDTFAFDATRIAACHLGRFCTCMRVLKSWTLTSPGTA
jgi:2'-5' RNA ligase